MRCTKSLILNAAFHFYGYACRLNRCADGNMTSLGKGCQDSRFLLSETTTVTSFASWWANTCVITTIKKSLIYDFQSTQPYHRVLSINTIGKYYQIHDSIFVAANGFLRPCGRRRCFLIYKRIETGNGYSNLIFLFGLAQFVFSSSLRSNPTLYVAQCGQQQHSYLFNI